MELRKPRYINVFSLNMHQIQCIVIVSGTLFVIPIIFIYHRMYETFSINQRYPHRTYLLALYLKLLCYSTHSVPILLGHT